MNSFNGSKPLQNESCLFSILQRYNGAQWRSSDESRPFRLLLEFQWLAVTILAKGGGETTETPPNPSSPYRSSLGPCLEPHFLQPFSPLVAAINLFASGNDPFLVPSIARSMEPKWWQIDSNILWENNSFSRFNTRGETSELICQKTFEIDFKLENSYKAKRAKEMDKEKGKDHGDQDIPTLLDTGSQTSQITNETDNNNTIANIREKVGAENNGKKRNESELDESTEES